MISETWMLFIATFVAYLCLYTAYDKTSKVLVFKNLVDLVTLGRGLDWTLVELNKAISLAALTTLIISFVPIKPINGKELFVISMAFLAWHSVYSIYKFYSFSITRLLNDVLIKKISIIVGTCCQVVLFCGFMGYMNGPPLICGAIILGLTHFWTMEVDFKYKLQVRPFAYLPFILGPVVLIYYFYVFGL